MAGQRKGRHSTPSSPPFLPILCPLQLNPPLASRASLTAESSIVALIYVERLLVGAARGPFLPLPLPLAAICVSLIPAPGAATATAAAAAAHPRPPCLCRSAAPRCTCARTTGAPSSSRGSCSRPRRATRHLLLPWHVTCLPPPSPTAQVWDDLGSWAVEFSAVYPQFSVQAVVAAERAFVGALRFDLFISGQVCDVR